MKLICLACLFSLVITGCTYSQSGGRLVIPGDFADPSVVHVGSIYYAAGTSSEWAPHFPIFKSTDLLNWTQTGYAFKEKPSWASSSFWAPELFYHRGKYILYYTARKAIDGISCIGVATSDDPEKGFTDHGILLEYGKEAIDAFVIQDGNQLYISWKAYGLDKRPIELLASRLSADGLQLEGEPFMLLKDPDGNGMEGQCILKHGQYIYILYSIGACCGQKCSYAVQVARASSIHGPFVAHRENPVLSDYDGWKCPGHGTLVEQGKDKWYYLYHAYSKNDDVYTGRQALLSEMRWIDDWPVFTNPEAHAQSDATREMMDDFHNKTLSPFWQWDFRNSTPKVSIQNEKLSLSGVVDTVKNKTGTVLTVRPYSGRYEMRADVVTRNSSLKGLVVYGDAGASSGIGVRGNTIQVWQVHQNKRTTISEVRVEKAPDTLTLKIVVNDGYKLKFLWSSDGSKWNTVGTREEFLNGNFLPQWDRSPRPGLHHNGMANAPGVFSNFRITYTY